MLQADMTVQPVSPTEWTLSGSGIVLRLRASR